MLIYHCHSLYCVVVNEIIEKSLYFLRSQYWVDLADLKPTVEEEDSVVDSTMGSDDPLTW